MTITPQIAHAIHRAAMKYGSNTALADRCGIEKSTIGSYQNGRIVDISDERWEKLYPYVSPFLPADRPDILPRSKLRQFTIVQPAAISIAEQPSSYAVHPPEDLPPIIEELRDRWPALPQAKRDAIQSVLHVLLDTEQDKQPPNP